MTPTLESKEGRVNPKTMECEKPGEKRDPINGNQSFLQSVTRIFYDSATKGFMDVLHSIFEDEPFIKHDGGIVDGTDIRSKSLRAPFNMNLYFFAPGTYMSQNVDETGNATPIIDAIRMNPNDVITKDKVSFDDNDSASKASTELNDFKSKLLGQQGGGGFIRNRSTRRGG